jgi:UPF0042 nucleotide-binding protein
MKYPKLVIITGLSGSGKTLVNRCFEDMAYYCVDNIPITLIPKFYELCTDSVAGIQKLALVIDVRGGKFLEHFPTVYQELKEQNPKMWMIFLKASDEALIRRFSESRRPHPLAKDSPLVEGIRKEREILKILENESDVVIDTTNFNVHQLREYIFKRFGDASDSGELFMSLVSFGFKYGIPANTDLLFDVRFIPNPYFVGELKEKTGRDVEVRDYINSIKLYKSFRTKLVSFLTFLIPHYFQEGKSYLTVSFGCTGGRHRSVLVAEEVSGLLKVKGHTVEVLHRDIDK